MVGEQLETKDGNPTETVGPSRVKDWSLVLSSPTRLLAPPLDPGFLEARQAKIKETACEFVTVTVVVSGRPMLAARSDT